MPRRIHTAPTPTDIPAEPILPVAPQEEKPAWPVLTDEERLAVKERHPGVSGFVVSFSGQTYVVRALSSRDWYHLTQQVIAENKKAPVEASRQDELIADAAIIWPALDVQGRAEFWQRNLAGAAHSLALQIRQKSGFSTVTDDGEIVADKLSITPMFFDNESKDVVEPSDEELEVLRQSSPTRQVYRAELPGISGVHYFRPWTRLDWTTIQQQEEKDSDFRDTGVRAALLWSSEDWTKPAIAGLIEQLFTSLLDVSGFNTSPTVEAL